MKRDKLNTTKIATIIVYLLTVAAFGLQAGPVAPRSLIVPLICMAIIGACALAELFSSDTRRMDLSLSRTELIAAGATIAYVGLIVLLGFYIASFLFVTFMILLLSGWSISSVAIAVAYAAAILLLVHVIFGILLSYFIPEGLLMGSI